jgi:hypothetical protein
MENIILLYIFIFALIIFLIYMFLKEKQKRDQQYNDIIDNINMTYDLYQEQPPPPMEMIDYEKQEEKVLNPNIKIPQTYNISKDKVNSREFDEEKYKENQKIDKLNNEFFNFGNRINHSTSNYNNSNMAINQLKMEGALGNEVNVKTYNKPIHEIYDSVTF